MKVLGPPFNASALALANACWNGVSVLLGVAVAGGAVVPLFFISLYESGETPAWVDCG